MADISPIREIKNEDGDLLMRVWEENPGTVLSALRCEWRSDVKELLAYPSDWRRLSDRQLYKLCQSAEPVGGQPGTDNEA